MNLNISNIKAWMKISDISVDISMIYLISMMFDTISAMTDISSIYRGNIRSVEISGFGKRSEIYRDISKIYLNDHI